LKLFSDILAQYNYITINPLLIYSKIDQKELTPEKGLSYNEVECINDKALE
jgi:DNA-binding Xre family transcriptional regulator